MKRKKIVSIIRFIFRIAAVGIAFVLTVRCGRILLQENGAEILIGKITVFSAKQYVITGEKVTAVSYFETVPTTSATSTSVTSAEPETTTEKTTKMTTIPTGENIKKVSEEKMTKGNVNYKNIHIKNTNKNHSVDIKSILSKDPKCKIRKDEEYQILVIHTHTTESYAEEDRSWYDKKTEWRNTDEKKNITSVGAIIADGLNEAGIKTLHITEKHDYPQYNGAYSRAKDTISEYLKKYPSIKMVIDVHRDSITRNDGTKVKPTAIIKEKKAAQVMIISGCDDEGDLNFPNWEYNLRMAIKLQEQITKDWPGLARPLYFAPFRYNMHMTPNSLLIEFGTEVNTLDEAQYTASLVTESLVSLLSKYIEEE